MTEVHVVLNSAFETEVMASAEIGLWLGSLAEELKTVGGQLAPVGATRKLRDGVYADVTPGPTGLAVKFGSEAFYNLWVEEGTSHSDAQPWMRATVTAVVPGARIVEGRGGGQ